MVVMEDNYVKNFDGWNEYAKKLNLRDGPLRFYEREVWWCALGVNIGSEQDGKNEVFERPVLIVRRISSEMIIVVPMTSSTQIRPNIVPIKFLGKESQILLQQIRLISIKRLHRRVSKVKILTYLLVIVGIIRVVTRFQIEGETPQ